MDIRFNQDFKAAVKNIFKELKKTARNYAGSEIYLTYELTRQAITVSWALAETQVLHQRQNVTRPGNGDS